MAQAAQAQAQEKGVNFLQQEAGISAYVKVGQAIDPAQVKGAFKTVETISDEYIIGEVALPDLPESAHPHVYVNKDGWIVAYYSNNDPSSKMLQWRGGGVITPNPLHEAILKIFAVRGEEIKYYNFKYPDANWVMFITEAVESGDEDYFHLTIPQGFRFLEASWSLHSPDGGGRILIDNRQIGSLNRAGVVYGDLPLRVGFRHTLSVRWNSETAVIMLLYQQ